jgi:hypothetical protein
MARPRRHTVSEELIMATITKTSAWLPFQVLEGLFAAHPAGLLGSSRFKAARRDTEEMLERMPPHLRDDLGLPPVPPEEPEHPALARARWLASRYPS